MIPLPLRVYFDEIWLILKQLPLQGDRRMAIMPNARDDMLGPRCESPVTEVLTKQRA